MIYTGRHSVWQDRPMKSDKNMDRCASRTGDKPRKKASPLDVECVDHGVTTDEIVSMIQEGRGRYG